MRIPQTLTMTFFSGTLLFSSVGADYHIDPVKGDDAAPGTLSAPWKSLKRANEGPGNVPGAGDTVYLHSGVHSAARFTRSGTLSAPIVYKAPDGAEPVIDGNGRSSAAVILGSHLQFHGIRFQKSGQKPVILARRAAGLLLNRVSDSNHIGCWLNEMKDVRIENSDFSDLPDGIFAENSSKIVIRSNRIGARSRGFRDGICLYAKCAFVPYAGKTGTVRVLAPGRAVFTPDQADTDFRKVRNGTLRGSGPVSSCIGFIMEYENGIHPRILPGGDRPLPSGDFFFSLKDNPEWEGKPYSPDGKSLMFDPGKLPEKAFAGLRAFQIALLFPDTERTEDVLIENNVIDGCGRQGIRTQRAFYIMIRNNLIQNCGATGIQLETGSAFTCLDENTVRNNNRNYKQELGIWIHENLGVLMQRNRISGHQKGVAVTQSRDVIARFNLIYDNRSQCVPEKYRNMIRNNTPAFYITGGSYRKISMPQTAEQIAVVHNTFYNNGIDGCTTASIAFGYKTSPPIGGSILFANNLVQKSHNRILAGFSGKNTGGIALRGNIWDGTPSQFFEDLTGRRYPTDAEGFRIWRETFSDRDSRLAEIQFADPAGGDFTPVGGTAELLRNPAPLAVALSDGSGREITLDNTVPFFAGFAFSDGRKITTGDSILIGNQEAVVTGKEQQKGVLFLDRAAAWKKGDPVRFAEGKWIGGTAGKKRMK